MFDMTGGLEEAMQKSEDYKIIINEGWIYVFPANSDFKVLSNYFPSTEWDRASVLTIDDDGIVRKNRYGVSG